MFKEDKNFNDQKQNIIQSEEIYCFSVSELSTNIRKILEWNFSYIYVKGEISGLSISNLGHCYFNLKDTNSVIASVLWKHKFKSVNFSLNEGMEVIVAGKITSYSMQSKYQISVDKIEISGIGSYLQLLERRKELLRKEGLFDIQYKKKLPFLPQKIALITSIKGSVIQDMLHRINDRCPLEVMIFSVSVQGEGADLEISKAIDKIEALGKNLSPDIIVIARGGGSVEDLMVFNSELLVRKVFDTQIPVVSAIGHETDYSLLDLVADLRAPTPTAAIELILPVLSDIKYSLDKINLDIYQAVNFIAKYSGSLIDQFQDFSKYFWIIDHSVQKFDYISSNINSSLENFINLKFSTLNNFKFSYLHIFTLLNNCLDKIVNCEQNLIQNIYMIFHRKLTMLENIEIIFDHFNINKTLKKGFSLIKNQHGQYIESIKFLDIDQDVAIELVDGEAHVKVMSLLEKK